MAEFEPDPCDRDRVRDVRKSGFPDFFDKISNFSIRVQTMFRTSASTPVSVWDRPRRRTSVRMPQAGGPAPRRIKIKI